MTTALDQHASTDSGSGRFRVVAVGAGLYALSGPGQTAGFSVFVEPVTASLDISRGQLTTGYLVATLLAAPSGIWLGRQLDHRSITTVIRSVGVGLAIALCVVAASPALWMLTLGILGLRLFGQTGFTLTSSVHVARSITQRRGAALGALTAAGGAAISLTPLLASRLIPHLGWRHTWLLFAVVIVTAAHFLAIAASRSPMHVPAVMVDEAHSPAANEDEPDRASTTSANALDRRRRNAFIVVAAGFATTAATGTALGFHQIAILEERGLSAGAAAANFLPQSLAAAIVALSVGRIVDRVNGRAVIPACMTLLTGALLTLSFVGSAPSALLYGLVLGSAGASIGASEGTLLARWLGTEQLGKVRGRLMATVVAASAAGPLAFTLIADAAGSYTTAASVAAVLPISIGLAALVVPLPEHAPA